MSADSRHKILPSINAFDYTAVPPELASNLRSQAALIREEKKATTAAIIKIGNHLRAVQEDLEYGQFTAWVEAECGFSVKSAQKYMRVAEFMECRSELGSFLSASTLYLLSARSAPAEVVAEVTACAEGGEIIAETDIKRMLVEARSERRDVAAKARLERRRAKVSPRTLRRREAEKQKDLEAQEQRKRNGEAAIKAMATALVERHGLESTRSFARSLLDIPAYELRDVLRHLVEADLAQRVDVEAP